MAGDHDTKIYTVDKAYHGERLDKFLAIKFPRISRTRLQKCLKLGGIQFHGRTAKANDKVLTGDDVAINFSVFDAGQPPKVRVTLDIIYEDEHLVAVHKPAGMVVHPVAKFRVNTLLDALQDKYGASFTGHFANRLDQFTSGIVLLAKDTATREHLQVQFERGGVEKEYRLFVEGRFEAARDVIDAPIAKAHEEKHLIAMEVQPGGKPSVTEVERLKVFERFSYLVARPKTGRQHQIRVHLAHLGHPVLCDPRYGRPNALRNSRGEVVLDRCALHSAKMLITHPATEKKLEIVAPLPDDFVQVLSSFQEII